MFAPADAEVSPTNPASVRPRDALFTTTNWLSATAPTTSTKKSSKKPPRKKKPKQKNKTAKKNKKRLLGRFLFFELKLFLQLGTNRLQKLGVPDKLSKESVTGFLINFCVFYLALGIKQRLDVRKIYSLSYRNHV